MSYSAKTLLHMKRDLDFLENLTGYFPVQAIVSLQIDMAKLAGVIIGFAA